MLVGWNERKLLSRVWSKYQWIVEIIDWSIKCMGVFTQLSPVFTAHTYVNLNYHRLQLKYVDLS